MAKHGEIVLPAGTTHVPLHEIPKLIAEAFYPQGMTFKAPPGAPEIERISAETLDVDYLRERLLHKETLRLREALRAGAVQCRSRFSPTPNPPTRHLPSGAVVDIDVLEKYAAASNIGVRVAGDRRTRPPPQQRFQEQEILRVIAELGHSPTALPKNKGRRGVKWKVRGSLPFTPAAFDHAWERLSAAGAIGYSND